MIREAFRRLFAVTESALAMRVDVPPPDDDPAWVDPPAPEDSENALADQREAFEEVINTRTRWRYLTDDGRELRVYAPTRGEALDLLLRQDGAVDVGRIEELRLEDEPVGGWDWGMRP